VGILHCSTNPRAYLRGPWNEGGDWEIVEATVLEQGVENMDSSQETNLPKERPAKPLVRKNEKACGLTGSPREPKALVSYPKG
jgi:hypothetical protein